MSLHSRSSSSAISMEYMVASFEIILYYIYYTNLKKQVN